LPFVSRKRNLNLIHTAVAQKTNEKLLRMLMRVKNLSSNEKLFSHVIKVVCFVTYTLGFNLGDENNSIKVNGEDAYYAVGPFLFASYLSNLFISFTDEYRT